MSPIQLQLHWKRQGDRINVILLGGSVNTKYQYTYGNDALNQLEKYYADKLILSVDGVSVDTGFSTYYQQEAQICRVMTEHVKHFNSRRGLLTKIGRTAFTKSLRLMLSTILLRMKTRRARN